MGENAPPSSENQKTATLYMFGTTWCPHCKTAKPIWDDYVSNNENLKVGNYDILFKSVDCDAEKNIADKFNVKGYPTFKLERGPGDIVDFEAKPTHDNFTSLLQTSLT
jgi:thiol-disulfide isomerase/thioredoxin